MAGKQSIIAKKFDEFEAACKGKKNEELLFTFRGVLYPSIVCSPEAFAALETMEARKDDVLIVAYPKCGTNWTLHILNEMIAAAYKDLPPPEIFQMLEMESPENIQERKNQPSPRVFTTHLIYDNIPQSFIKNKVKILVVFRNPKDAAVSYYHFYNKNPVLPNVSSWNEFFRKFMSGEVCWQSYFDHALAWNKHMDEENIMILTFEDMKENLYEGVKQIAKFYGFPLSDEKIQSIVEKATFQSMKNKSQETFGGLGPVLLRKGEVGDWKTLFTEAQSQEMDAKFNECLAGTKLGAKLKYDKYSPGCSLHRRPATGRLHPSMQPPARPDPGRGNARSRERPRRGKRARGAGAAGVHFHFRFSAKPQLGARLLSDSAGLRGNESGAAGGEGSRLQPAQRHDALLAAGWELLRSPLLPGCSYLEESLGGGGSIVTVAAETPPIKIMLEPASDKNSFYMVRGYIKMADAKARLNEYCQRNKLTLTYIDTGSEGPSHDPVFTAVVSINNRKYDPGTGKSKKEARGHAAQLAWRTIEQEQQAESSFRQQRQPLSPPSPLQASQVPQSPANISEASPLVNYISWLNFYKQTKKVDIEYIWGDRSGAAHTPIHSVACKIGNKVFPEGTGRTKQAAKLNAARLAYEELNSQPTSRTEQSGTPSNNSRDMPFSNSQEVLETPEKFVQNVKCFASNTSDSVIFQDSGASSNGTDSGLECKGPVDRLSDAFGAVKLNETSSLASPEGAVVKPKRKETPLAPKFSNLSQEKSKYTDNERFLEDYKDIKRIGSGGFGNVFKAKHKIDDSIRAIKRVKFVKTKGEKAEREVQVLAKLKHENIVRYYTCWIGKDSVPSLDSSLSDDSLRKACKCLFIEMEFCENGTLAAWISKKRDTPNYEDSLNKFQQIAEGVEYIHSQNVIHRDLKPANILISRDNKIKIGDFGLATSGIDDLLVARTENRGTKSYMAPEQVGNKYGKKVDIFPLGLIFFELVYAFSTDNEKFKEWENIRDSKFPQAFVREFPKEKVIISQLLSKNPAERPSATVLLNILKNNRLHTC
ncbi:uncharacterized protein [Tiliqua scincoides]|uniref:uncharacterized protein n=1 Tax=Tiliqua scincoides TaxID=71010 RepID=UPI003461E192